MSTPVENRLEKLIMIKFWVHILKF